MTYNTGKLVKDIRRHTLRKCLEKYTIKIVQEGLLDEKSIPELYLCSEQGKYQLKST